MSSYQSETNTVRLAEQVKLLTRVAPTAGATEHLFWMDEPQTLDVVVGDELYIRKVGVIYTSTGTFAPLGPSGGWSIHSARVLDVFYWSPTLNPPPSSGLGRQYFKLGAYDDHYYGVANNLADATFPSNLISDVNPWAVTIDRLSPRVTWPLVFRMPNAMRNVKKIEIDSINLKTVQTTHHETPGDPGNFVEPAQEHPFYSITVDEMNSGSLGLLSNVQSVGDHSTLVIATHEQDLTAVPCNIMAKPDNSFAKQDFPNQFDLSKLTVHVRDPQGKYIKCHSADVFFRVTHERR